MERSAGQKQTPLRLKVKQALPSLGLEVFDVLRLVKYKILPFLASECRMVLYDQLVAGDAYMEGIDLCPALKKIFLNQVSLE